LFYKRKGSFSFIFEARVSSPRPKLLGSHIKFGTHPYTPNDNMVKAEKRLLWLKQTAM
jgi:hypothetical protein